MSAFTLWGVFPIYFRALQSVPTFEILCHRIFWSVLSLAVFLILFTRLSGLKQMFSRPKLLMGLALSAVLIASNWLTYIWAISVHRALETSLGYFINPIVSIILGMLILKERLKPIQLTAVIIALIAVAILTISYGSFPWIAFTLAFTFGFYGLVRKLLAVDPMNGLFVESLLLFPLAVAALLFMNHQGSLAYLSNGSMVTALLTLAGIVTVIPLWLFVVAAKRLNLSTVGFLQYIAPTLQFLIAVFVFKEPFTSLHLLVFGLIWFALALYSLDSIIRRNGDVIQKPISLFVDTER
ncbi:MAG: EamA family transporter RarD [Deltaproteobacteria bacterium]|nr:EamA family transporter RarD [Deltaproteobacteria bacterium]